MTPTKIRRWPRRVCAALLIIFALFLGPLALLAASLAAALVFDSPFALLSVGLAASLMLALVLSYLALRVLGRRRRWPVALMIGGGVTLIALAGFAALFLKPLVPADQQFVQEIPDGVEQWLLPTGSLVAVRKIAAKGIKKPVPIVFLHGGPGAYSVSLRPTVDVISRLSADGYDVYFYDQVGGGLSARLPDIADYTMARHLADLEAVHDRIASNKIILIGSSGGATLGASYMANHPGRIAAAVFSGPGPIYHPAWRDIGDGGLDERMTPEQSAAFAAIVETPRLFAAVVLADINPRAAVLFAGENEMGSLFDKVANEFYLPIAVCDAKSLSAVSSGYGFWSNRMTTKTLHARVDDPRPAMQKISTPVLVVRGECDYKKEAVAQEYMSVFPNAQFRMIEDSGHMPYWETPDTFLRHVRVFLEDVID